MGHSEALVRTHTTLYALAIVAVANLFAACGPEIITVERIVEKPVVVEKTTEKTLYVCADGSKLETDTCPPVSPIVERYVQCQDESVVKVGEACPTPVPETIFVCASNGQRVADEKECPTVTVTCPEGDMPYLRDGVDAGCLEVASCHEGWGYVPSTASTPAACKRYCEIGETLTEDGINCMPVPNPLDCPAGKYLLDGQCAKVPVVRDLCPVGQQLNGGRCYVAGPTWPLEIQMAGDSPDSRIILGNSLGAHTASFKMKSGVVRSAPVRDVSFSLCPKSTLGYMTRYECGEEMIQAVHLVSDDGLTVIATAVPSGAGLVHFHGLQNYSVSNSAWTTMRVTVDVGDVGHQQKFVGSQVQINVVGILVEDTEFGRMIYVGNAGEERVGIVTESNTHTLHRSKPTVSLASGSPSGAAVPSFGEAVRFNVSADSRGYVGFRAVTFTVSATDNTNGGNGFGSWLVLNVASWQLYDASDLSTPIPVSSIMFGDRTVTLFGLNQESSAGHTKTYILKVNMSGASAANDDSIRVDITDIVWTDDGSQSEFDGSLIKNLPVRGGTQVF